MFFANLFGNKPLSYHIFSSIININYLVISIVSFGNIILDFQL